MRFENIKLMSTLSLKQVFTLAVSLIATTAIFIYVYNYILPDVGVDFGWVYYPVARDVLEGHSPYVSYHYMNVPWAIIPILPLALLPVKTAAALYCLLGIIIYAVVARKLGADMPATLIFLFSPPVLLDLMFGNLNSLTMLGFILPPWLGLFFLAIKPQVGIGFAIFLFFDIWKKQGFVTMVKTFAPVAVGLLLSYLIFGQLPGLQQHFMGQNPNVSYWPWAIPLGLWLVFRGIRKEEGKVSAVASPFLSPYTTYTGYVVGLLPFLNNKTELLVIIGGMYLTGIVRFLQGF